MDNEIKVGSIVRKISGKPFQNGMKKQRLFHLEK